MLVAHRARLRLHGCRVSRCAAAFMAGQHRGRSLELHGCTIERSARKLWAEYQDSQIDKKATWFARASMPFAEPSADKLELSLRRKWQW